jgi:hypothetical protein
MRWLRKSLLASVLLSCAVLALVARGQPGGPRASSPPPTSVSGRPARTAKPATKSTADQRASPVLARFAGGTITERDLREAIGNKAPLVRKELASAEGRLGFLAELVRYDLLLAEAERRGYANDQMVLDAIAHAAIDRMKLRDLLPAPESIPADEVARYFEEKRSRYARAVTRRASHILVATEAEASALIADLADADPARFAHAAVEHSKDPHTHDQGGEIGYVARDGRRADGTRAPGVPDEVLRALFEAAAPGVVPTPVRHAGGYSVVLFARENPAIEPNLASLERVLREELALARQAQALAALEAKLREEWKPVVHVSLVEQVMVDPKPLDIPEGFPAAPNDPRAPTIVVEEDGI